MKFLPVIAILLLIIVTILIYKKNRNIKKMVISFGLIIGIITFALIGNVTRTITPFFLTHIVLTTISYFITLYYILRDKFIWYIYLLPILSLTVYGILSIIGNKHI